MDTLINAWANVQWMVYHWFADWWNGVQGAITTIERISE